MGRLINQTESDGTVKTFAYDANGNRTGFTLQRGTTQEINLTYAYDNLNRLIEVKKGSTVIVKYSYDVSGNRSLLEYPQNGVVTTYGYNDANLVTSLENKKGAAVLSSYRYTYYLDGNQKDKTDHTGMITSYLYDGMGRLTQESEVGGKTIAYAYDRFSNRSKMTVSGTTESYTTTYEYHPNNWLLKEEKRQGKTVERFHYRYDANGNQVYREREKESPSEAPTGRVGFVQDSFVEDIATLDTREYNGFNQLVSVYRDGVRSQYSYRPDGLRYSKTVKDRKNAQSVHIHLWDGQNIVAEIGTTNTVTARYLRGINLIAREQDGANQYYLFNAHGDVTQRYDALGNLLKNYKYDAFGNEENPEPLDSNPFRYCGEYFDKETGEIYLRARYYDPTTGRFGAEDPAKHGLNWYTYCGGNPVLLIDPSGLSGILPDGELYISLNKDQKPMKGDKAILSYMKNLYRDGVSKKRKAQLISQIETIMSKGKQYDYWSVDYTFGLDYYTIPDITDKLWRIMEDSVRLEKSRIELGYLGFANLVGLGKKYDLKSQKEWQGHRHFLFMNQVIGWDDPGNILYGYFGRGIGFAQWELLGGAGAAQILDGNVELSFVFSNLDDPRDQASIKQGIDLYKAYNIN
ncbi:RHS repeat-associated core domain-containing protein [Oscillospiraceae bacterium PP1C4]